MRKLIWFLAAAAAGAWALLAFRSDRGAGRRPVPASEPPKPPKPAAPAAANAPAAPGGRCAAITRSGSRCTRDVEPGSDYCWQHGG